MALLNHAKKELSAKIVYYGPGLSGKTTNIEWIHRKWDPDKKGKLISLETKTDRTLFFDFLPVQVGQIGGYRTRFNVYTVPGQIFYNETRKMVLKGVDGIVFVADSQQEMSSENLENLRNLAENLKFIGKDVLQVPMVLQYNKRDLPNTLTVQEMNRLLNPQGIPCFEAIAVQGDGVLTTLARITRMVVDHLRKTLFADLSEECEPPPQEPAPASEPSIFKGSMYAPRAEEGPAFLGGLQESGGTLASGQAAESAAVKSALLGSEAEEIQSRAFETNLGAAQPEPILSQVTPDLRDRPGEELSVTRREPDESATGKGEDAREASAGPAQLVPENPAQPDGAARERQVSEAGSQAARAVVDYGIDPALVSFPTDDGPEEHESAEISILLGHPEREAANEIQIPLSIRRNGTGERLTFRLMIRLDSEGLSA